MLFLSFQPFVNSRPGKARGKLGIHLSGRSAPSCLLSPLSLSLSLSLSLFSFSFFLSPLNHIIPMRFLPGEKSSVLCIMQERGAGKDRQL